MYMQFSPNVVQPVYLFSLTMATMSVMDTLTLKKTTCNVQNILIID